MMDPDIYEALMLFGGYLLGLFILGTTIIASFKDKDEDKMLFLCLMSLMWPATLPIYLISLASWYTATLIRTLWSK